MFSSPFHFFSFQIPNLSTLQNKVAYKKQWKHICFIYISEWLVFWKAVPNHFSVEHEMWDFHDSVAEDSGLLECDAVSLGEQFQTFWKTVLPSSAWSVLLASSTIHPTGVSHLLELNFPVKIEFSSKTPSLTLCCNHLNLASGNRDFKSPTTTGDHI